MLEGVSQKIQGESLNLKRVNMVSAFKPPGASAEIQGETSIPQPFWIKEIANCDISAHSLLFLFAIVFTTSWTISTNKLILKSINNRPDLRGTTYTLVYVGVILNILLVLLVSWIVILILVTETPREGVSLTAIKASVILNAFVHCSSVFQQLQLLTYQLIVFTFPQLESTIKKQWLVVVVISVVGNVGIASFLLPAFSSNSTHQVGR